MTFSVEQIKGVMPALMTPYDNSGAVNFEMIRRIVTLQLDEGAGGFFFVFNRPGIGVHRMRVDTQGQKTAITVGDGSPPGGNGHIPGPEILGQSGIMVALNQLQPKQPPGKQQEAAENDKGGEADPPLDGLSDGTGRAWGCTHGPCPFRD